MDPTSPGPPNADGSCGRSFFGKSGPCDGEPHTCQNMPEGTVIDDILNLLYNFAGLVCKIWCAIRSAIGSWAEGVTNALAKKKNDLVLKEMGRFRDELKQDPAGRAVCELASSGPPNAEQSTISDVAGRIPPKILESEGRKDKMLFFGVY